MNFLRHVFPFFFPTPEPDWTTIADRWNWPVNVTRSRWVAGP